jgi:alkylated DNA repair dioxygenase AlkB
MSDQPSLFDLPGAPAVPPAAPLGDLPEGLIYREALIDAAEEAALAQAIAALPFKPFQFHGYEGNRRVVSFGWAYDFARQVLEPAEAIPDFLLPLRARVAALAGRDPEDFRQALAIEYAPGAGIGWHRDRPQFEIVAGVSLLASCPFRVGAFDPAARSAALFGDLPHLSRATGRGLVLRPLLGGPGRRRVRSDPGVLERGLRGLDGPQGRLAGVGVGRRLDRRRNGVDHLGDLVAVGDEDVRPRDRTARHHDRFWIGRRRRRRLAGLGDLVDAAQAVGGFGILARAHQRAPCLMS